MLVPFSVFRFLMISVLLSLDKNWMMIGVVPSLRLGSSLGSDGGKSNGR